MFTFKYGVSHKIIFWSWIFDSLLEFKYAIPIQKDFEFLHTHIPIYYDPRSCEPTNYIRNNIRRYTPDFIIRHKVTGQAFCVEIKPRPFAGNPQLTLRKQVAENYISWKNLDWSFKVIFDDEIVLTSEQEKQFNECKKLVRKSTLKLQLEKMNKIFDRTIPAFYSSGPDTRRIQFAMHGQCSQKSCSKQRSGH